LVSVVIDIETDGIDATVIHCAVCRNIDTDEVHIFKEPESLKKFTGLVDCWIGHNIIAYDWLWLAKLWGITLPADKIRDTLILSQLLKQGIDGGHSLEAWAGRLGSSKVGADITDFSTLTAELMDRCVNDTSVNAKLYSFLLKKLDRPEFREAIDVEHRMAFVCLGMHLDGFKYNKSDADKILAEINDELCKLDSLISVSYKPKVKKIREVTPRLTQHGTLNRSDFRWYKGNDFTIFGGGPFTLFKYEEYNPNSNKQLVDILDAAGWKPTNKTKTGQGYKIDEQNLATLPDDAPEAATLLVKRLLLVARLRTLVSWQEAFSERDGRIHGRFHTLGTYTHRMSHTKPNMGNVSAEKSIKYKGAELKKLATELGGKMRKLWVAEDDAWLVGTDMEGAHLRILGHLMDDKEYIQSLLEGDKKLGTDIHSRNKDRLGHVCPDRDLAKTFIFTFLNGGGVGKVVEIFGCSRKEAAESLDQFIASYPGLLLLRREIYPRYARQGFFPGADGRLVCCDSEHLMMAAVLQNYEAVIMKHSNILWRQELKKLGIRFKQVNLVHDEFQTEVYGDRSLAERVGHIQADSIRKTGERFGIRCPLAGEFKVGKDWLETH
jgi:DNA polymerase-1